MSGTFTDFTSLKFVSYSTLCIHKFHETYFQSQLTPCLQIGPKNFSLSSENKPSIIITKKCNDIFLDNQKQIYEKEEGRYMYRNRHRERIKNILIDYSLSI